MKASAVSTITKSLPIGFPTLVNYSLLATLGYINLFSLKEQKSFSCAKRLRTTASIFVEETRKQVKYGLLPYILLRY